MGSVQGQKMQYLVLLIVIAVMEFVLLEKTTILNMNLNLSLRLSLSLTQG